MLVLKSADREPETVPLHLIKSTHTKFDILKQFLPNDFLAGIMERGYEERSSSFAISKGMAAKGGSGNFIIERSAENAITYIVVQTLIQEKQKKQTLVEALKEAMAELKEINPNLQCDWAEVAEVRHPCNSME
eukprot:13667667-Ditylum_brightwellii.AAC.1